MLRHRQRAALRLHPGRAHLRRQRAGLEGDAAEHARLRRWRVGALGIGGSDGLVVGGPVPGAVPVMAVAEERETHDGEEDETGFYGPCRLWKRIRGYLARQTCG